MILAFTVDSPLCESITIMGVREQVFRFCGIIFQLLPQLPDVGS
jgi:hypothetical protein